MCTDYHVNACDAGVACVSQDNFCHDIDKPMLNSSGVSVDVNFNETVNFNVVSVSSHENDTCEVDVNVHENLQNFTHTFYNDHLSVDSTSLFLPDFDIDFRTVPDHIGGRLTYFAKNYEKLTSNQFLLSVIRDGYKIKFIDDQPPPLVVNARPFYLPLSDIEQENLDKEMQNFLDQKVIEECDPATPGFYAPVFLREKKPDVEGDTSAPKKFRVIHDLSKLNKHIVKYRFKMDSASSVRAGLKQGMHFYCIDIKSAYNHLLIHPDSRKYLRCWWKGRAYCFRALPFGLSSAPWIFSSVMAISAKFLHTHSVYSFFYLDDVMMFNFLLRKLIAEQPIVLLYFQMAGWVINFPKSLLDVVQRGVYIGIDIDLCLGLVYPTNKKWQNLQDIVAIFMSKTQASAKLWARLLGLITCLQDLTVLGRVQARTLQFHLNAYWKDRDNLWVQIPVTSKIKQALQWWQVHSNVMAGTLLRPRPATETITSDASCHGYGAVWRTQELQGEWSPAEKLDHINILEGRCIQLALIHWEQHLVGKSILIETDSSTVVSHINRGSGCHSIKQHLLIKDILTWCQDRGIHLTARHLPGRFNQLADILSRGSQIIATEWTIHHSVMTAIIQIWERPHVDMFATRFNTQLPTFFSPIQDPTALAVDAMTQSWINLVGYAFPPFALLPQVLNKIQEEDCIIFLIAPCWPRQHYFPLLLDLLVDFPRQIPVTDHLLKMPRAPVYHPNPQCLDLHVYKLSNKASLQGIFHQKLRNLSAINIETQLANYMKCTGAITFVGVNSWGLKIPSGPLYQ